MCFEPANVLFRGLIGSLEEKSCPPTLPTVLLFSLAFKQSLAAVENGGAGGTCTIMMRIVNCNQRRNFGRYGEMFITQLFGGMGGRVFIDLGVIFPSKSAEGN